MPQAISFTPLEELKTSGMAVVQPPTTQSGQTAVQSYQRVTKLLKKRKIQIVPPSQLLEALGTE